MKFVLFFLFCILLQGCAQLPFSKKNEVGSAVYLTPKTLRSTLIDHVPQFKGCYQIVLDQSEKAFEAKIELNFAIGPDGRVIKALVTPLSTAVPDKVRDCSQGVLSSIIFPPPSDGGIVQVKQRINFIVSNN